jgi:DNA modification methylase
LEGLAAMPDECVQVVVTSPPYWGLRKYAGEQDVIWGGKADCEHKWSAYSIPDVSKKWNTTTGKVYPMQVQESPVDRKASFCSLCGAWRGALGLEPTIEAYVAHIVTIFREVRRVLRRDGICFINLGDSYFGSNCGYGDYRNKNKRSLSIPEIYGDVKKPQARQGRPKDLCMIPARVALALQAAGWYLRSDIIWHKPNPMPESVTDRPTKSYDHIFLLTKSAKYFWDVEALKETAGTAGQHFHADAEKKYKDSEAKRHWQNGIRYPTRNCRDVWTFSSKPFSGAHFAVFPPELPRRCILAGSSHKACPKCAAPWKRITKTEIGEDLSWCQFTGKTKKCTQGEGSHLNKGDKADYYRNAPRLRTLGWEPTCKCEGNDGSGKCLVLDPFAGSGTTLAVAAQLGRDYCGIEIAREYEAMINKRLAKPLQGLTARDVAAAQGSLLK